MSKREIYILFGLSMVIALVSTLLKGHGAAGVLILYSASLMVIAITAAIGRWLS